jgi:1-acyl-sn-glycerol-3-phosphate acyltransferase
MRVRPNPLPWTYRWRSNLIHVPLMTVITVACGSLSLLVSLVDKKGNAQHRIARFWARGCIWASGSKLRLVGAENLRKHPVAVYASNHTSYMDTPVIFAALPFQFRILARTVLWPIPFIGWYLNRSKQIPIDTNNPRATLSSLGAGVKALRSGMALFVFPGGRADGGRRTASVSFRRGLPGHSRASSTGADGAERSLRAAADSHPPLLPRRAEANDW